MAIRSSILPTSLAKRPRAITLLGEVKPRHSMSELRSCREPKIFDTHSAQGGTS